jgi:hypothetical protein
MAAGQSRVAQAIRAIVLDIIKDRRDEDLTEQQKRDALAGRRGIGYMFPDGLNAGGVGGTAGATQLGSALGNLSDYTTNEQLQHVLDAIENGPKSVAQALNMPLGSKAMAINGLMDCETGKAVEIVNTPEFKPPADWTDAQTPPVNQQWTLGIEWHGIQFGGGSEFEASTSHAAMQLKLDSLNASFPPAGPQTIEFISGGGGSDVYTVFETGPDGVKHARYTLISVPFPCTPGSSGSCPLSNPVRWPTDNKMQLSRGADGKFKFSSNEPSADIIPDFTDNQHSRLDLCFSDGSGRKATIESSHDGGWIIYERDPVTGEPIGTATRYNQDNVADEKFEATVREIDARKPVDLFI